MKPQMKTFDEAKHNIANFKYAHIKRDGHFLKLQKSITNRLYAWTSNPTDITHQLHYCTWFERAMSLPAGVSLLGELYLPGKRSEAIKTAIKEQDRRLEFQVFAIDNCFNNDAIQSRLIDLPLDETQLIVHQLGFTFIGFISNPRLQDLSISQKAFADTIEGFVLKNGNLKDWYKFKPRKTIDLIVQGFTVGTGKYSNQLGALQCYTTEGYEVANVSGMTDTQRSYFSMHSDKVIGKVIEVEYQNVGANGRLRHPVFVRLRDDKEPNQCSVTQDDDLCKYWDEPLLKG